MEETEDGHQLQSLWGHFEVHHDVAVALGISSIGRACGSDPQGRRFEPFIPSMKIIFLDIDGVLNSMQYFIRTEEERKGIVLTPKRDTVKFWSAMFDPDAVKLLNIAIEKSGAKVVLSSSWRNCHPLSEIRGFLKHHGFIGEIIDKTPQRAPAPPYRRGNEIQAWLTEHPEVEKFVIIDDDSDMEHLKPHLVQTKNEFGIQEEHVVQMLLHLGA